ncbi:diguanylate cyclase [Chitinispirillales bacterium ANBcel5]|uniref:sensor domain-containing diguanylate cyclase n=1 Tax=Cellulosispirillum alkaliphilum TaxID=3039283 RepID=UPI002A50C2E2|nr:diguanylate cyclase [Chitinispirillales bacterium ANBcel5]
MQLFHSLKSLKLPILIILLLQLSFVLTAAFMHDFNSIFITVLSLWTIFNISLTLYFTKKLREEQQKSVKHEKLVNRYKRISNYFESILQDSSDIIFSLDCDGYILKFANGAQFHLGYSQEEIVGKPFKTLLSGSQKVSTMLNKVISEGRVENKELQMKTKNDKTISVVMSLSVMRNESTKIIGMVATAKDITARKKLEAELIEKNVLLKKLAITDNLTNLYNVRHFHDQIKRELKRLKRAPQRKLSLIMVDIDHFKELNDSEGHQMGDQVLRSLGKVIEVCIRRDIDTAYRYGGDEFVIILPDTTVEQARVVALRIQHQFGAFRFGNTSLSIGIAAAKPGEDEELLVKRADSAMYISKKNGKAKITLASDHFSEASAPVHP